jgi:hypothetical protein
MVRFEDSQGPELDDFMIQSTARNVFVYMWIEHK